mmetsp:Transcript_12200/g.22507  ORF Transcript_12200/g.22507 Transcript_12200/m.22507 type:complete len:224 (+) Transcript_12200:2318-2989(+)
MFCAICLLPSRQCCAKVCTRDCVQGLQVQRHVALCTDIARLILQRDNGGEPIPLVGKYQPPAVSSCLEQIVRVEDPPAKQSRLAYKPPLRRCTCPCDEISVWQENIALQQQARLNGELCMHVFPLFCCCLTQCTEQGFGWPCLLQDFHFAASLEQTPAQRVVQESTRETRSYYVHLLNAFAQGKLECRLNVEHLGVHARYVSEDCDPTAVDASGKFEASYHCA